ncbi:MAG: DUF1573 domain-containing protein [Gemmatimonadota bacterium]|nr:DUF1573 domain-containing protein [Gemmatimonadota bacterium]
MTAVDGQNRRGSCLHGMTLLAALAAVTSCGGDKKAAPALSPDTNLDFGRVVQGKLIEYAFTVRGDSAKDFRIRQVRACELCQVGAVDSVVPRGGAAKVTLLFDTKNVRGPVNEVARVYFTDSTRRPVGLRLKGSVVWPVEFDPQSRVYFFAAKGERAERDIVVQNNESQPLRIASVTSSNPFFRPAIRTLEDGRRYRVTIALDPAVPVGKHEARITLATDNPKYPTLPIHAFAQVRNTVATDPSKVDYGTTAFASIKRVSIRSREVLVTKTGAKDFVVSRATVDLPFMEVVVEPHKRGESAIVRLRIDPKRAKKGEFKGTLLIETNDANFPLLRLPVTGNLV